MFKYTVDDVIMVNPKNYSHNLFWQINETNQQKVYSIISNYLSSINKNDILQLCSDFGRNMVKSVLNDQNEMYAQKLGQ